MPKGPNGEKRPADTNACAVKVARIATGEEREEPYAEAAVPPQSAGGKARAERLPAETRRKIASTAAKARWSGKEVPMTEKERLLKGLLERPDRKLVNIKFSRGPKQVTEEEFCAEVNEILFAVDNGLTKPTDSFPESDQKQIDVKEFAKQFA